MSQNGHLTADEILAENKRRAIDVATRVGFAIISAMPVNSLRLVWPGQSEKDFGIHRNAVHGNHSFIIRFPFSDDFAIAVSVPLNAITRETHFAGFAIIYRGSHIRPASIGYEDVSYFYGQQQICNEVIRLQTLLFLNQIPTN